MKKLNQKDKHIRNIVNTYEIKHLILQNIRKNGNLSKLASYKSLIILSKIPKKSFKTQIINRCVLTSRRKRIHSLYNFSRLSFLKLARNGFISGLKKSSW